MGAGYVAKLLYIFFGVLVCFLLRVAWTAYRFLEWCLYKVRRKIREVLGLEDAPSG